MEREFGIEDHPALAEVLSEIRPGETVTLTKGGKPVAHLQRQVEHDPEKARAAIERIKARRPEMRLDGLKIKDLINEGRKH